MKQVQLRWLVSLSDGTTAIEGKAPFEEIDGELSPWQKLIRHMAANRLTVKGIRIELKIEKEGQTFTHHFNLPSVSPKQKWNELEPILPTGLEYRRRLNMEMGDARFNKDANRIELRKTNEHLYMQITAFYPEFDLIMLVDEEDGSESWSLIVPKGKAA